MEINDRLLETIEKQQQIMLDFETRFLGMLEKSEARIDATNAMIQQLSDATHHQTDTYILQINRLSKRLDTREEEIRIAQQLMIDQGKRIEKLLDIIHDATRSHDISNNTYNNM